MEYVLIDPCFFSPTRSVSLAEYSRVLAEFNTKATWARPKLINTIWLEHTVSSVHFENVNPSTVARWQIHLVGNTSLSGELKVPMYANKRCDGSSAKVK